MHLSVVAQVCLDGGLAAAHAVPSWAIRITGAVIVAAVCTVAHEPTNFKPNLTIHLHIHWALVVLAIPASIAIRVGLAVLSGNHWLAHHGVVGGVTTKPLAGPGVSADRLQL